MITPESPDRLYSTRLRTALVLTGSGTAGAYHAGVLRALHEAGVRIDLIAGRGAGAVGAVFAAVDGGTRLWEENGLWKGRAARDAYGWRFPLRAAAWAFAAAAAVVALPALLLVVAVIVAIAGLLMSLVGLERAGAAVTAAYGRAIEILFAPTALPTIIPRLALLAALIGIAIIASAAVRSMRHGKAKRRLQRGLVGRTISGPLAADSISAWCAAELWGLIRGAAPLAAPLAPELGRRYIELLTENLGQPGFRELIIAAHDMDARRDVVFALLVPRHRARFFSRASVADTGNRQVEAFDLSGAARDHALDALSAALALPLATDPHLVRFAPEGPWRGETHRVCDRPGAIARVLEEVLAAGAEQVVFATAVPPAASPHELGARRADLRGVAGEAIAAFETAAIRDAIEQFTGRFAGLFVIRPPHNPLSPLDFAGIYDERSDRVHTVAELTDRGYEDAYRQFIEPVVGASGEKIATVQH